MTSQRLAQSIFNALKCQNGVGMIKDRIILRPEIPLESIFSSYIGFGTRGITACTAVCSHSQTSTSRKSADEPQSSKSNQTGESGQSGQSPGNDNKAGDSAPRGERDSRAAFDAGNVLRSFAKEVHDTMMPLENVRSYTKRYTGPVAETSAGPYSGSTDIAVVKREETPWQKAWSSVNEKLGSVPYLNKLMGFKVADTTAYQKGQQLVEDLKEKYETSDHPVIHKVEEYKERIFSGSEASRAMQEIRIRDPSFDMNIFLRSIKFDVPVVTKAFLSHDVDSLRDYCGPEMMQRAEGIRKAFQEQELKEDPTILFVGDVEAVEVRLVDNDPFVICQFHCQQLKCVRDKFGNVVEGSPDNIHRVYYFWGLQQEKHGVVTADGVLLPPRWVIKDMLWQSMLALV